jgi:hypothetical protein
VEGEVQEEVRVARVHVGGGVHAAHRGLVRLLDPRKSSMEDRQLTLKPAIRSPRMPTPTRSPPTPRRGTKPPRSPRLQTQQTFNVTPVDEQDEVLATACDQVPEGLYKAAHDSQGDRDQDGAQAGGRGDEDAVGDHGECKHYDDIAQTINDSPDDEQDEEHIAVSDQVHEGLDMAEHDGPGDRIQVKVQAVGGQGHDGARGGHGVGVQAGEDDDARGRSSRNKTSQEKKRDKERCLEAQDLMMVHNCLALILATVYFGEDVSSLPTFNMRGEEDIPKSRLSLRLRSVASQPRLAAAGQSSFASHRNNRV